MNLLQRFQQQLEMLPLDKTQKHYVVAYSGGMDSHVLLLLCKQAGISARAVHVHHGLQAEADSWLKHCETICETLGIPFTKRHVDATAANGQSPENAARIARYQALQAELKPNEVLLTAHHRDDQSETLFIQLLRGAGPAGLAAMPMLRNSNDMLHARPLLEFSRDELVSYAQSQQLEWVEDPSNLNTDYDRNLLRQTHIPQIKLRWPQLDVSLSQVARQQQDVLEIVEAMAAVDLAAISTQRTGVISINELNKLSLARQANVLRYWIKLNAKDAPTANVLQQLFESVLVASEDAEPVLSWGQSEIRRYQNGLYLLDKQLEFDTSETYTWSSTDKLNIPSLGIELGAHDSVAGGLAMHLKDKTFIVGFRQGGEKLRPAGRKHTHSLKKLMQETGIPPWERSRIPLLYLDDQLVSVVGYWDADEFSVSKTGAGWKVYIHHVC